MSHRTTHQEPNHALDAHPRDAPSALAVAVRALPVVLAALLVLAAVGAAAVYVPAVAFALGMLAVAGIFVGLAALPVAFAHAVGAAL